MFIRNFIIPINKAVNNYLVEGTLISFILFHCNHGKLFNYKDNKKKF